MVGSSNPVDQGKMGKTAVPVVLTLLAGLGGSIVALHRGAASTEPLADNLQRPTGSAVTQSASESVVLVAPSFAVQNAATEPASPMAGSVIHSAFSAPHHRVTAPAVAGLAAEQASSDSEPALLENAFNLVPQSAPSIVALELPQQAVPSAVAAPPVPAVIPAIAAAPVVQPAKAASNVMPESGLDNRPAAALAENAPVTSDVAIELPTQVATVATPEPVSVPQQAAVSQLAIADWSYSLPEQSASSNANAFAAAPGNSPITLAPVHRARPNAAADSKHLATQAGRTPAAVGKRRIAGAGFAAGIQGRDKYQLVGSAIEFKLPVVANGTPVGDLTLHVAANQQVSLRLKELLSLFHDQFDPQALSAMVASPDIDSFVTFDKLRDAGIDIRYDAARDRLSLSVDQP